MECKHENKKRCWEDITNYTYCLDCNLYFIKDKIIKIDCNYMKMSEQDLSCTNCKLSFLHDIFECENISNCENYKLYTSKNLTFYYCNRMSEIIDKELNQILQSIDKNTNRSS